MLQRCRSYLSEVWCKLALCSVIQCSVIQCRRVEFIADKWRGVDFRGGECSGECWCWCVVLQSYVVSNGMIQSNVR